MYEQELNTSKEIAMKAGEIMMQYFEGDQGVEIKDDESPVTKADILINKMVIEELIKVFPEDGIVAEEESTSEYGMGRKWICDPIDGTQAFVWGIPTSMFSLALVVDGRPEMGVAYDPFLKRLYTSIRGEGSFCNDVKLSVSTKDDLDKACVAITGTFVTSRESAIKQELVDKNVKPIIVSGCVYKSMLVARGKFQGYISTGVSNYDTAASDLIVAEAGGKVTSPTGEPLDYSKPFSGAVFSNGVLHDEFLEVCRKTS